MKHAISCAFRLPVLLGMIVTAVAASEDSIPDRAARFRKPAALLVVDQGRTLLAANQASGSISIIDLEAGRVRAEVEVGRRLSDVAGGPDGSFLLATDPADHQLVILERMGDSWRAVSRLAVASYPERVRLTSDGRTGVVASLWSRRLTLVELERDAGQDVPMRARVSSVLELPFSPRNLLVLEPEQKVLVADAFGGGLAVVDLRLGRLESVRTLPAHNITAMVRAPDEDAVLLTHQVLNNHARTTADDLHWGSLINNSLRTLLLADLLEPGRDPIPRGQLVHYDTFGSGAGDPTGLLALPDGQVATTLGGVGQFAIGPRTQPDRLRIAAGRRPITLASSARGETLYLADPFDDRIVEVERARGEVVRSIDLGAQPPLGAVERGERLFHDARLSHEGWMSCQSCHTDGHTNGLRADTFGDGSFGDSKRVLSLLGVGETAPYAWSGEIPDLESQIRKSIQTTMRGPDLDDRQVGDLTAYLRSLEPPPARSAPEARTITDSVDRGREVFRQSRCDRCHAPPSFTSPRAHDVGLTDSMGRTRFNPPSLRGVGHRARLFHDNRARSLEDVFLIHGHPDGEILEDRAVSDLVSYLRSL